MFIEIFEWILSAFVQILEMLKKIELFEGFTLYSLIIALLFCGILGILLKFILGKDSD